MEQPILGSGAGCSARRPSLTALESCRVPSRSLLAISSAIGLVLLAWPSQAEAGVCEAWSEMDTVGTVLSIPVTLNDVLVADVMYDDGRPEVVVTVEPGDEIAILEWQRDGTFAETLIDLADCENPWGMDALDLDGDGDTDFCVVCATSRTMIAMFQDPAGQFCQEIVPLNDPLRLPAAVAAGAFSDSLGEPSNLAVVLSEDPACSCLPSLRGFTTAASGRCPPISHVLTKTLHQDGSQQSANWGAWAIESGSIVGGSHSDLAITYGRFHAGTPSLLTGDVEPFARESDHFGIVESTGLGVVLRQLIGVQGEGFGTNIRIADIAVSDLSGDDVDDVALCTGYYGAFFNWVTIRPSDGDSLVAYSDFAGLGSGHPNDVDVADLDEDGDDDLVVMASVHDLVLIEVETGEIVNLCRRGILGTSMVAGVGDFDLDGNEDLVVLASHDRLGSPTHVAYFVTR